MVYTCRQIEIRIKGGVVVYVETHEFEGQELDVKPLIAELRLSEKPATAIDIVGYTLGLTEEKDLATLISEGYDGPVNPEFYVEDESSQTGRSFVRTEDVKQLIVNEEDLIIILEHCYDVDERNSS